MNSLKVKVFSKLKEFDLDIDFTMEKGVLGILGASGCGKSMTLKSIAGIHKPTSGTIELNNRVFFDSNQKVNVKPQKRKVGYLFQNYALFPNMSVEENISVGLQKGNKEIVSKMIQQFSLQGLEKRYPNQLSGGQQQRVALARILAYNPDVLLLDEPFSAMDAHLKEKLRLELSKVLSSYSGITILVTHDREEAYQLCDQIMILDQGKILIKGNTYDIFEHPSKVKVASLTGCKNISKVQIIDSKHIYCEDWNVTLEVENVKESITHIGIRAHDLLPCTKEETNAFWTGKVKKHEMPFEWEVLLENGLWWKVQKDIHDHSLEIPEYLCVKPQNIILLEE